MGKSAKPRLWVRLAGWLADRGPSGTSPLPACLPALGGPPRLALRSRDSRCWVEGGSDDLQCSPGVLHAAPALLCPSARAGEQLRTGKGRDLEEGRRASFCPSRPCELWLRLPAPLPSTPTSSPTPACFGAPSMPPTFMDRQRSFLRALSLPAQPAPLQHKAPHRPLLGAHQKKPGGSRQRKMAEPPARHWVTL